MAKANANPSKGGITKQDIHLTSMDKGKLAFVLHNVYTKAECEEMIRLTEERGYEPALVNIGGGRQQFMPGIRNSARCIWDSEEIAGRLWDRIKEYVPQDFRQSTAVGLNERMRFLRYDKGEYFKPHHDGCYQRKNGEISFITVMFYLNEGFKGGNTNFLDHSAETVAAAVPKPGSVLIFQHDVLHEGSEVIKGRKYAVRTDVMYKMES